MNIDLKDENIQAFRAKAKERIPVVLSIEEVQQVLLNITGINNIVVSLLYGCGLRIKERLKMQIQRVQTFYTKDLNDGFGDVYLPHNLAQKYQKSSRSISTDFRTYLKSPLDFI